MSKLVRPLAVIGAASALSLAAYQITGGTHGGTMAGPVMAASPGTSLRAYDLARLSTCMADHGYPDAGGELR